MVEGARVGQHGGGDRVEVPPVGGRAAVPANYAGALEKGHTVIPVILETFGAWPPTPSACSMRPRASTPPMTRASTCSFYSHHVAALSSALLRVRRHPAC